MNATNGEDAFAALTDRFPRSTGAFLLLVGLVLAKWQIYNPLHAVSKEKREWYLLALVGLAIVVSLYGAALLIFGRKTVGWFTMDLQNVGWKKGAFFLAVMIATLAVHLFIDAQLESGGSK